MTEPRPWCWTNGELHPRSEPTLRADDSAYSRGLGCYTTARTSAGRVWHAERHAARLARDTRALGIGSLDPADVVRALYETAMAAFPAGEDGVVRVQASRSTSGRVHLTAVPRGVGTEPSSWRACTAPFPHEGPMPWRGAKVSNHLLFAMAALHAARCGVDEALLLDRAGYLVEGARSSVVVVDAAGRAALPCLSRGGVAGIARELALGRVDGIAVRHVAGPELLDAAELVAINAVRGARAIVALDGEPVGDGRSGPWARRLDAVIREPEASGTVRVTSPGTS